MDETKEALKAEREAKRAQKKEAKKWKNKVCRSTTVFSLLRVPFTIAGFFLGALIPLGIARFTSSGILLTIGSLIGVFVYKQVTNWGKNQYQSAQIAIITVGMKRHRLPKNTFASGMKMVNFYFEASAITSVLTNIIKYCYNKVFNRMSFKEAQEEVGSNLLEDIKAMVVVTVCTLIPYLGYCIMSHMVYYAECTRVQAVCDAVEGFFKNLKKMIPRMLKVMIPSWIKLFFNMVISTLLMYYFLKMIMPQSIVRAMFSMVETNITEFQSLSDDYATVAMAVAMVAAVAFAFALNLLSQSSSIYDTVEKYYEAIEENPSEGYIYSKLKKIDKDAITLGAEIDEDNSEDDGLAAINLDDVHGDTVDKSSENS